MLRVVAPGGLVTSVLAINPNTNDAVSALVARNLKQAAPAIDWRMATGRFGARYILSEAAYAIAAHAAIDAWASHARECDAVLLACFGDPGLFALRELCPVPVVGLAEASMHAAAAAGGRFSIVTGGARWPPMLERLAQALGYGSKLAGTRAIVITGAEAAADPERAVAALAAACRSASNEDEAEVVILGGAGFAGLGARVEALAGLRVIDSVAEGAHAAAALALGSPPRYVRAASDTPTPSIGVAAALADKLFE